MDLPSTILQVLHLCRKKSAIAFRLWQEEMRFRFARLSMMRNITTKLRGRLMSAAFARWYRLIKLFAARSSAMRMISSYRLRASRSQAFSHWHRAIKYEVIRNQQKALSKYIFGQKFGEKFSETRNYLAKVIAQWKQASIKQQHDRGRLRRIVSRKYMISLERAFALWYRTAQTSVRDEQKHLIVDTMHFRARHIRLAKAFRCFTVMIFEAKRIRSLQIIALDKLSKTTKRRAFRMQVPSCSTFCTYLMYGFSPFANVYSMYSYRIRRHRTRSILHRLLRVRRRWKLKSALSKWHFIHDHADRVERGVKTLSMSIQRRIQRCSLCKWRKASRDAIRMAAIMTKAKQRLGMVCKQSSMQKWKVFWISARNRRSFLMHALRLCQRSLKTRAFNVLRVANECIRLEAQRATGQKVSLARAVSCCYCISVYLSMQLTRSCVDDPFLFAEASSWVSLLENTYQQSQGYRTPYRQIL